MGDKVSKLFDCEIIAVEPVGELLEKGWLPGTFVKYSNKPLTIENESLAFATVDRSDGRGTIPGFLLTGPKPTRQAFNVDEMWKTDYEQNESGEHRQIYSANNAGNNVFNIKNELILGGTRCVSMVVIPTGFHKFYVFERNIDDYEVNQPLYVSANGKLTNQQDYSDSVWAGYMVARKGSDSLGKFLLISAGMM